MKYKKYKSLFSTNKKTNENRDSWNLKIGEEIKEQREKQEEIQEIIRTSHLLLNKRKTSKDFDSDSKS